MMTHLLRISLLVSLLCSLGPLSDSLGFSPQDASAALTAQDRSSSPNQDDPNLPDWAEPTAPSPSHHGRGRATTPHSASPSVQSSPTFPTDPNVVPIDTHLPWLAIVGVGYALYTLRRSGHKPSPIAP